MPPATALDRVAVVVWALALWFALRAALGSLTLPPTGETLSTRALLGWLLRWVAALLVGGAVGGAFVRPRGRWREVFVGGLLIGGAAALFAFMGFFLGHDHSCGQSGDPCDTADTFGSLILALPSAVVVICGGLAGRAATRMLLRFRRRSG